MAKTIAKASYILGVLREMDILGTLVTFKSEDFLSRVMVELPHDHPFEGDGIFHLVSVPEDIEEGQILFEVDGAVYKADVERKNAGFKVPEEIILCEAREGKRVRRDVFHHDPIFVEVRGMQKKLYGELVNSDKGNILVQCSDSTVEYAPGDYVEVRGYVKKGDVLNRTGVVLKVRQMNPGFSYVINLEGEQRRAKEVKRSKRFAIDSALLMSAKWPEDESFKFEFEVLDMGYLGFKGRLIGGATLPPLGSVISVGEMKVRGHLIWRGENTFGCDLAKSDKQSLGEWQEFVQEKVGKTFGSYASGVRNKRILNVFLRSGYLRKHKAYIFGQAEKIHEILPSNPKLSGWIQRYGNATGDDGNLDTHISFLRLTNYSWLIQEASSMSLNKGVGKDLIIKNLERFYYRNLHNFNLHSYIYALYDANMSFNEKFWDALDGKDFLKTFDTLVLNYQGFKHSSGLEVDLSKPSFSTWKQDYKSLAQKLSRYLLGAFDIKEEGWNAEYLRSVIQENYYSLNRKVHLVKVAGEVIGVAVQFGLPTIANVTSTANHLYVLLNEHVDDFEGLAGGFLKSRQSRELSGVTEIVFVKDRIERDAFAPPLKRHFKLKLIECLSLKEMIDFFREGA